ncbi:MAG: hypothetical protein U9Q80_01185, partial [Bacillota bacterium]|nr:hypothetical protein [Bacillota bacterium]
SVKVSTFTEKKTCTTTDENGNIITEIKTINKRIKTIYVDCLATDEMASIYNFDKTQLRVLEEMKKSGLTIAK